MLSFGVYFFNILCITLFQIMPQRPLTTGLITLYPPSTVGLSQVRVHQLAVCRAAGATGG